MPRIRTIKPEFWTDEKLAILDPITRLVYLGLISLADDYGRLIDNVKSLDGQIFPFTDETCSPSLDTLASLQRIVRYTAKSGQHLIQIVRWDHQKVNHPGKEVLPPPTAEDLLKPAVSSSSGESLESGKRTARKSLASYHGPRTSTNDLGPSASGEAKPKGKYPHFPTADSNRLHQTCIDAAYAIEVSVVRKFLAPLYPASGPRFPIDELDAGLKCYLEIRGVQKPKEARWWTLKQFAEDAGRYVRLSKMPLNDDNGLTERGQIIWDAA